LDVGKQIETPDAAELERLYPNLCPKPEHRDAIKHRASAAGTTGRSAGATVYVVQEGDTLFDIARYELGKAARWAEIYQLNRDRLGTDFDYLTPGLELVMPAKVVASDQPVGTMTQRSGAMRRF
jgi:nucleoid-associated protein YgaU